MSRSCLEKRSLRRVRNARTGWSRNPTSPGSPAARDQRVRRRSAFSAEPPSLNLQVPLSPVNSEQRTLSGYQAAGQALRSSRPPFETQGKQEKKWATKNPSLENLWDISTTPSPSRFLADSKPCAS